MERRTQSKGPPRALAGAVPRQGEAASVRIMIWTSAEDGVDAYYLVTPELLKRAEDIMAKSAVGHEAKAARQAGELIMKEGTKLREARRISWDEF